MLRISERLQLKSVSASVVLVFSFRAGGRLLQGSRRRQGKSVRCPVVSELHAWRSLSEVVGEVIAAIGGPSPATDVPIAAALPR